MSDSDSLSPQPFSTVLPFLLDLATTPSRLHQIVVLDHSARTVVVFQGQALHSLLHQLSLTSGPLPASKASIDAMPALPVTQIGVHCAVCLEEFQLGEDARSTPCNHMYHSHCIQKWLRVHGTCPVCRFAMPVEDFDGEELGGREGRIVVVNLWVRDGDRMDLEHQLADADSESLEVSNDGRHSRYVNGTGRSEF